MTIGGGAGVMFLVSDGDLFDGISPDFHLDLAITPNIRSALLQFLGGARSVGNSISKSSPFTTKLPLLDKSLNGLLKHPTGPDWGDLINYYDIVEAYTGAPNVTVEGYIWPNNSIVTIGDNQYASLWGTLDLIQQRFKQMATDGFSVSPLSLATLFLLVHCVVNVG
jgi:hypothetical protein